MRRGCNDYTCTSPAGRPIRRGLALTDSFLATWLPRTDSPSLSIVGVGITPDRDGERLLEALLRFRRALFCPVPTEVWPRCLLLPPVVGLLRRLRSMHTASPLSAFCLANDTIRIVWGDHFYVGVGGRTGWTCSVPTPVSSCGCFSALGLYSSAQRNHMGT